MKEGRTDLYRLLLVHEVGDADGLTINGARIAELCSRDWGLEKTVTINLDRLREGLQAVALPEADRSIIRRRLDQVGDLIAKHPKSRRWQLRAMVGERVRWYEDPDEP